jgi:hypothetical protein
MFVQGDQYRRRLLRDSLVMGITIGAAAFPSSPEVTTTEDLMREHGVIRRALLVYIETAPLSCGRMHSASMLLRCGK